MSDTVVDKILGVTGGVSWLVSYIFYRLYRSRTETARNIKSIPILDPGQDLVQQLSQEGVLGYAAVEGIVKDLGRKLRSRHGDSEGVVMQSQLIEHKSQRINGFWNDVKKVIRDTTEYVPFAIASTKGGDSKYQVEVLDPGEASRLLEELHTTYDRFEPNKSSLMQIGIDRLFGEVNKGLQESEKMLLTGTSILGIGRLILDRGKITLNPPENGRTYVITKLRLSELVRVYEAQSSFYKIAAAVAGIVGGGLVCALLWRQTRNWFEKRRLRLQFEDLRRTLRAEAAERRRERETRGEGEDIMTERSGEEGGQGGIDNSCVVCLGNPRQVITLNCGHISMCTDCAEALPIPKKCPVCRANVERFMPVFHP